MSLTKKRKMTPTQSQNMAKQESKQKYFSTNPRDKMENYMDYSSESYSNKQGLENVKQYVPPSDKHRISNHNLIPQSSPDEKKNIIFPKNKIAVNKTYTPDKKMNWYSKNSQEDIANTKKDTESVQSETAIDRNSQDSKNHIKNKSLTNTKKAEDLYFTQNEKADQTQNAQDMQNSQEEEIDIDKDCQNYKLKYLLKNLHSREIAKNWQYNKCANSSSSTDTLQETDKIKESIAVQEASTLSFLTDDIKNSKQITKIIHDKNNPSKKTIHNYQLCTQSLIHYPPNRDNNGKIARHFAYCYGHTPYAALFSPQNGATTTFASSRQGTDEAKAHTILNKISQMIKYHHDKIQNHSYTDNGYEDFLPWKPKEKLILTQQQYSNPTTTSITVTLPSIYFIDDNRNPLDIEVDRIQENNYKILSYNGFQISPFRKKEQDSSLLLYAGSMTADMAKDLIMYICKPCDVVSFNQTHYLIHHTTTKHQENTKTWIHQHYIIQEIKENPIQNERRTMKILDSIKQFYKVMEMVKDKSFPGQHRVGVAFLITKFFTSPKNYEIKFSNEFKQRHWIMTAFKKLQQQQNVRQYLKDSATQDNCEFLYKSEEQRQEVELIADLARKLFTMLVECEFIPTHYLSILALVMCQHRNSNYPASKVKIINSCYLDLLLTIGAVRMTHVSNNTPVLTITEDDTVGKEDSMEELQLINTHMKNPKNRRMVPTPYLDQTIRKRKSNTISYFLSDKSVISRDTRDGDFPNFCQTAEGKLNKSFMGQSLCNYCGKPDHKRQDCKLKSADRTKGITRIMHPSRQKNISAAQEISKFFTPQNFFNPY